MRDKKEVRERGERAEERRVRDSRGEEWDEKEAEDKKLELNSNGQRYPCPALIFEVVLKFD